MSYPETVYLERRRKTIMGIWKQSNAEQSQGAHNVLLHRFFPSPSPSSSTFCSSFVFGKETCTQRTYLTVVNTWHSSAFLPKQNFSIPSHSPNQSNPVSSIWGCDFSRKKHRQTIRKKSLRHLKNSIDLNGHRNTIQLILRSPIISASSQSIEMKTRVKSSPFIDQWQSKSYLAQRSFISISASRWSARELDLRNSILCRRTLYLKKVVSFVTCGINEQFENPLM